MFSTLKLTIVGLVILSMMGLFSWGQYQKIKVLKVEKQSIEKELKTEKAQKEALQKNLADIKEQQRKNQIVITASDEISEAIQKMKDGKCINEYDEKVMSSIVTLFNTRGGLLKASDSPTEILPTAGTSSYKTGWTLKEFTYACYLVTNYSLLQDNCIECLLE